MIVNKNVIHNEEKYSIYNIHHSSINFHAVGINGGQQRHLPKTKTKNDFDQIRDANKTHRKFKKTCFYV